MNLSLSLWLESLRTNATPDINECITYLSKIFPLLTCFKDTIQDKVWHAEGDVHVHTNMVLKELYSIFDKQEFKPTNSQRRVLILSALLHDIAKPLTTKVGEDGRVRAKNHEEIGKNYLIYRLLKLNLPIDEYLDILNLVGYHQKPKLLVIKDLPIHEYLKLNSIINYELIYWLEVADMRGRVCEDLDEQLLWLDEFKNITHNELNNTCRFETTLPSNSYVNLVGNYLINTGEVYSLEEASLKLYEKAIKYSTVTILCGVSGSGKSTYIDKYLSNSVVISLDNLRSIIGKNSTDQSNNSEVLQVAHNMLKEALRSKKDVVWDATSLRKEFREKVITIAHNYGALTKIVVVLSPLKSILNRNASRFDFVPALALERQIDMFQFPNNTEAHILEYYMTKELK